MKTVGLGVVCAIALVAAQAAHASPLLNFTFSFTDTTDAPGNGGGTVTGEVFGLTNNATGAASDVVITSYPALYNGLIPSAPFDIGAAGSYGSNTFTVANGVITSSVLTVFDPLAGGTDVSLQLDTSGDGGFPGLLSYNAMMTGYQTNTQYNSTVTYQVADAPEPGSLALLGSGLVALLTLRRRRPIA